MFGAGHEAVESGRVATSHTPGGTGALRVAADFIHQQYPKATVWLTQPTWPNHPQIFAAAGVPTKSYAYFDAKTNGLAWDAMPGRDPSDSGRRRHHAARLLPQPDRHRPDAGAVEAAGRRDLRARPAAASGLRLPRVRRRHRRGCRRAAGVFPAGPGADCLQFVLQELWALLRAGRCADDRCGRQEGGRHRAEPGEGVHPLELLESAGPRGGARDDGARRQGPAQLWT